MEPVDFSRIKAAFVDTAVSAACLAIFLGLVGATIERISPGSVGYWHAASLAAIILTVVLRSVAFTRSALRELQEAK